MPKSSYKYNYFIQKCMDKEPSKLDNMCYSLRKLFITLERLGIAKVHSTFIDNIGNTNNDDSIRLHIRLHLHGNQYETWSYLT